MSAMSTPLRATVARGSVGAAATGHPLATAAALACLRDGGNAVDAAVTAQAVLTVVLPQACGLGGDALALVGTVDGVVTAYNGSGPSPAGYDPARFAINGGASATVPGTLRCWADLVQRQGRRGLDAALAPATLLADEGFAADQPLVDAAAKHRDRLLKGGAQGWEPLQARPGDVVRQPALATTLLAVAEHGPDAFYTGPVAEALCQAARRDGGWLAPEDLNEQRTVVTAPVTAGWDGGLVHVQPPASQGVLLAMALRWLDDQIAGEVDLGRFDAEDLDHLGVELTEAVFAFRHRCARDGEALLDEPLDVDLEKASRRGGPRAYLHTTGVAVADADGTVVSSLLSLFDSFGSATFAPDVGVVLNNRAAGFTVPPNDPAPNRRPVHTLAPALLVRGRDLTALATPGADGQIQTLLQILIRQRYIGLSLPDAVAARRWRSVEGGLLVEAEHPCVDALARRGHAVETLPAGDVLFGGVVSASYQSGQPSAVGDWRRQVSADAL
jgi:gamma-glutamyltranspeptidase/glutathione hydrolase